MYYRIIIILFCLSAELMSADFFSSFRDFSLKLYRDEEITFTGTEKINEWDRIFRLYIKLREFRLQKLSDTEDLCDEIEEVIDDIGDNVIKELSLYEKEFLEASLYGSLAYLNSSDPSLGMFRNVRRSKKMFDNLNKKYGTADTGFGSALSEIATGMYFHDSFWVKSVLGYKGNILKGLKQLDRIAYGGDITKIEANLFLIEYFSNILKDHNSSVRYSKNLHDINPGSKYFTYIYARDLYHTGKVTKAYPLFKEINDDPGEKFYVYQYDAIIYEAMCLYIKGSIQDAEEVVSYASKIHDGYILKKFRNEWVSSAKIRQEIVFRPQYLSGLNLNLSADELERTAFVYFDHGFFRETARVLEALKKAGTDIEVIKFKTAVVMQDWKKAEQIYEAHEQEFRSDPDRARLEIMKNIVSNHLELF